MAVTITRTARIDDDGTGTTGTVINNAEKTSLYNEIDTALAKVAQLAGGNTFTGTQTMSTVFLNASTNIANAFLMIAGPSSKVGIGIQDTDPTNNMFFVQFFNSAGAYSGGINHPSATTVAYLTSSDARLKTDLGRADDLRALRAVVVHDFTWRADGVHDRGVFAQEAHALYPRAVSQGTDETTERGDLKSPWMTDYSKFVPDLIVGWQQHDAELAELRAALALVRA